MVKITIILLGIYFALISVECQDRNYIWNVYNKAGEEKAFLDIKTWRETYKKSVFDNLTKLPQPVKDTLIAKANKDNKKEWVSKLVNI